MRPSVIDTISAAATGVIIVGDANENGSVIGRVPINGEYMFPFD